MLPTASSNRRNCIRANFQSPSLKSHVSYPSIKLPYVFLSLSALRGISTSTTSISEYICNSINTPRYPKLPSRCLKKSTPPPRPAVCLRLWLISVMQYLPRLQIKSQILRPTRHQNPDREYLPVISTIYRWDYSEEGAVGCYENVRPLLISFLSPQTLPTPPPSLLAPPLLPISPTAHIPLYST